MGKCYNNNPRKPYISRRRKKRRAKNLQEWRKAMKARQDAVEAGNTSHDAAGPSGDLVKPDIVDFEFVQVKKENNPEDTTPDVLSETPLALPPRYELLDPNLATGLLGSGSFSDPIRHAAPDQDPIIGSNSIFTGSLDNPIRISGVNVALVTKNGKGSIDNPIRISTVNLPGNKNKNGTGSLDNPIHCRNPSEVGATMLNDQRQKLSMSFGTDPSGSESGESSVVDSSLPESAHALADGSGRRRKDCTAAIDRQFLKYLMRKNEDDGSGLSSNGHFLLSLESDLASLTPEGQASFKKKVLVMLRKMVNSGA